MIGNLIQKKDFQLKSSISQLKLKTKIWIFHQIFQFQILRGTQMRKIEG